MDCGAGDPIVLEFDHVGVKRASVTRLAWTDAKGGHEKAQDAYQEMQAMVGVCNSAGGDAQAECELRLKITMNMALGNTLRAACRASLRRCVLSGSSANRSVSFSTKRT